MMTETNRSWLRKFAGAGRGVRIAVGTEVSFYVHLAVTAIVLVAGAVLGISIIEWCLIVLCIATVLAAEMFNTSIERIARAVTNTENRDLRDALDMASGAVLIAAAGAAILGVLVLGVHALELVYD